MLLACWMPFRTAQRSRPFSPHRMYPGIVMSLAMYRHTLAYTTKPIHGPGVQTAAEVAIMMRMAEVIGPPAEVLSLGISPISPLTFPDRDYCCDH